MEYGDELPCGGFEDEDVKIEEKLKEASLSKDCQKECDSCQCQRVEEKKHGASKICKKCSVGNAVLVYKTEPICQDCLFKNIEYKCRLLLENTFKVDKDSNLLVCLSGGLNSICMLNIITNLMKRYQKHKLFNKIGCIHIQQQGELPIGYQELFEKVTGVELTIIKLECILNRQGISLQDIRQILSMFEKSANTIDLLNVFRDRLILEYANKNGYQFVLKGLNGQTLAAEVFKYFSKGLGGNLPLLSAHDNQKGHFYYPLRNNLQKELQYYFYINKLSVLAIKSNEDNIENFVTAGLDSHLKKFIDTLQNMYSHTAPAIVRTSEKIETNLQSKEICAWCLLPGAENKICRRCFRVWQARKMALDVGLLPLWMRGVDC